MNDSKRRLNTVNLRGDPGGSSGGPLRVESQLSTHCGHKHVW